MTIYIDEIIDKMLEEYDNDFEYQIKQRGKEYYKNGKVKSLIKSGNIFKAKVEGSHGNDYNVSITIDDEDEYLDYECDCPYEYPCKHVYATMLKIKNKEYAEVELKPEIHKSIKTLQELIIEIPAEETKEYLLSEEGKEYVCFEMENFEKHFSKYLPKQDFEFYYNTLYNKLIIDGYCHNMLSEYFTKVKALITSSKYEESFNICKSIIEASKDTNHLNKWDELIDSFPTLGMNMRIIYRKSTEELKTRINEWINTLEENNYYESLYLEDIILTIK